MRTGLIASGLFFAVIAASVPSCGSSSEDGGSGGKSGGSGGSQGSGTGGAAGPSGTGGSTGSGGAGPTGSGGSGPPAATFAQVETLLNAECGVCHNGMSTDLPQGQNLKTGNAYDAIVNIDSVQCASMGGRKRVKPGDPDNSYLLDKMKGIDLCSGVSMPYGTKLPDDKIAIVESWIRGGAMR